MYNGLFAQHKRLEASEYYSTLHLRFTNRRFRNPSTGDNLTSLLRGWSILRKDIPKGFEKFFPKQGQSAPESNAKPKAKGN